MKVIQLPSRLRWALLFFGGVIPLSLLESLLATRSLPWSLRWPGLVIAFSLALVFFTLFAVLLSRGKRWVLGLITGVGALWVLLGMWYGFRVQNYGVAFFSLFLAAYLLLCQNWVRLELGRSFLDPRMAWYQGLPKAIPGLVCDWQVVGELRVGHLDAEGAFVFVHSPTQAEKIRTYLSGERERLRVRFRYGPHHAQGTGDLVAHLPYGAGAGIEFRGMTLDDRKEFSDFIEKLRGEGHV